MDRITSSHFSLAYPRNIAATLVGFAAFMVFATIILPIAPAQTHHAIVRAQTMQK